MRKKRIHDLNIKATSIRLPKAIPSLQSDVRMSSSSEVEGLTMPGPGLVADSERIKERTSFGFAYLRLDLTVTKTRQLDKMGQPITQHRKGDNLSYEVELEIADINFLIANMHDEKGFRSIVRRFLQNSFALTHMLAYCREQVYMQRVKAEK